MTDAADLVLHGGRVFDGRRRLGAGSTAVAVHASAVTAVGADDDVADLVGPHTEVVDLRGGLVLPGFQDAHVHPVQGGLERRRCDLTGARDRAGYLELVAAYTDTHPDDAWVTGGGWAMPAFPGGTPRREDLDRVAPGRAVLLLNRDHHGAWASSRALELAGVDAATPDPRDGRIERDADGTPTGTLHEGAMRLVQRLVPRERLADQVAALLDAQSYLHSLGITAWQDAIVGRANGFEDAGPAYQAVASTGRLTARVVGALWWRRGAGMEELDGLVERREALSGNGFRATSVKIMLDGVAENHSAAMLEPYGDGRGGSTGERGHLFVEPRLLAEAVTRLDALGFQVHVHTIGDRAVRTALDAFDAARRANGPSDGRHHLAHLQVVHPDDLRRFAELRVAATVQPLWACYDAQMRDLTLPFLGEPRASWQYPFADLQRAGAVLAAGSDWPVSSPDPLAGIHVAVNRRPPAAEADEGSARAFLPGQRLTLRAALAAYTAGSAYVNHLDGSGRLVAGRAADLVALDRDPFEHPTDEIADTVVTHTFVGGRRVS